MKRITLIFVVLLICITVVGCTAASPYSETMWTRDVIPGIPNTYSLGSATNQWDTLFVNHIVGVPIGGGTGNVTSSGGTVGAIAKFTTARNIENSSVTEAQVAGAVTNSHVQNTDTILTTNGVTALINAGLLTHDLKTDRWLLNDTNTFLGVGVTGAGVLAHTVGVEGYGNTAFGNEALHDITTSYYNTAIGYYALRFLTTGIYNTAIGQMALANIVIGQFNTAVGMQTLNQNTGSSNTAVGMMAGGNNVGGSGNVFIGNQAGENEAGSNKLYIDNSNTATPLIYGDFSTDTVAINGDLKVTTPSNVATSAVTTDGTQTITNKTLTLPKINENVNMTITSTNLNLVDDNNFIMTLLERMKFTYYPSTTGYSVVLVGTGVSDAGHSRISLNTGVNANSSALARNPVFFVNTSGADATLLDFSRSMIVIFNIQRIGLDTEVVAYYQIKSAITIGALASKGIGLKIVNYRLWSESYNTVLGNIDLGVTMTSGTSYRIMIVHTPSIPKIEWYVDIDGNGFVLKGSEITSNKIPQSVAGAGYTTQVMYSIANGVTGGTNCSLIVSPSYIWINTK